MLECPAPALCAVNQLQLATHRHVMDSRYKSSSIQAESYPFACQRCIEFNPVRAAVVDDPAHYRWTSYRANALGQADPRSSPYTLYLSLGKSDKEREPAYRTLFRAQLGRAAVDDIRLALNRTNHQATNVFTQQ